MPRSPISPATSAFRNKRLSVIAEDGSTLPAQARNARNKPSNSSSPSPSQNQSRNSIQASHRPESRQWTDKPPRHSAEASPPGYEHWNSDVLPSRWSRVMGNVRSNRQLARRGGWRRLLLLAVIVLLVIIALAVGLGVGLSQRNSSSSSSTSSSGSSGGSSGSSGNGGTTDSVFPEGSYAIPVYSSVALTSCTSKSSTWLCYPYSTYSEGGASNSKATYFWIVSAGDSNNPPQSFNISTSNNPFADMFSNVPLTLQNQGTADEHYAFETTIVKTVVPSTSIAPNGGAATCYFNSTILRGELYTQKAKLNITASASGSSGMDAPSAAESSWQSWPYAVNVTESAAGGQNVPNCYAQTAQGTGTQITGFTVEAASEQCVCGYQNFGL